MKRHNTPPPAQIIVIAKIETYGDRPSKKRVSEIKARYKAQGQVIAIVVSVPLSSDGQPQDVFILRARRAEFEAAKALGWKEIKAVIVKEMLEGEGKKDDRALRDAYLKRWVEIILAYQENSLSDYDLAKTAIEMNVKWRVSGTDFATTLGLSKPYTYNLMRWYRSVPDIVREAWRTRHPFINQSELERLSHMKNSDAVGAWELRLTMKSAANEVFSPSTSRNGHQKKGQPPIRPRRRASEQQITKLKVAIDESRLTEQVKNLATAILKFVLGAEDGVDGITNYKRLHPSLVKHDKHDKKPTKKEETGSASAS
jgi:hypothetical protein